MDEWTFTERVDLFLELAAKVDRLRLTRTGIELSIRLEWSLGQPMSGWIADVDEDDLQSFLTAWRQLVTRSEPTHLPTILERSTTHLRHPKLRELAGLVRDRLDQVNRNAVLVEERPRPALTQGEGEQEHEFSPWEVADLFMHGEVFHRKDRAKRKVLEDWTQLGFRPVAEWVFRQYLVDVTEAMANARLILLKAKEKDALSNDPIT